MDMSPEKELEASNLWILRKKSLKKITGEIIPHLREYVLSMHVTLSSHTSNSI